MKRKLLLVVLSAFTAAIAVCQTYVPFPTSNAKWNNLIINGCGACEIKNDTAFYRIAVDGDTIASNLHYYKLWNESGSVEHPSRNLFGLIREMDKKVYVYLYSSRFSLDNGKEQLLYDFSKQVGDTVFHHQESNGDKSWNTHILEIDSVSINGQYRKRFRVENMSGEDYWVEGIGSLVHGFASPLYQLTTSITYQRFICFSENGNTLYLNPAFNSCYPSYLISSIIESRIASTKVYQQDGSLIIESSEIPDKIEVCDLLGKNIFSTIPIAPKSSISLSYCKGVYLVKTTLGKNVVTNKVVIR